MQVIRTSVRTEVEGTCLGKLGYCVCVTKLKNVGKGLVRPDGTGLATFNVCYECIVLRPFKGQVLDVTVKEVIQSGFIAEIGPVQIFVSSYCIPDSFTYSPDNEGAFESTEKDLTFRIKAGQDVRLKIMSVRVGIHEIKCVGTFNERGLGLPTGSY